VVSLLPLRCSLPTWEPGPEQVFRSQILCLRFSQPGDPGQTCVGGLGSPLWVSSGEERARAAERICLFVRTRDPEQESRPGCCLAELDGQGLQFSETHFSYLLHGDNCACNRNTLRSKLGLCCSQFQVSDKPFPTVHQKTTQIPNKHTDWALGLETKEVIIDPSPGGLSISCKVDGGWMKKYNPRLCRLHRASEYRPDSHKEGKTRL